MFMLQKRLLRLSTYITTPLPSALSPGSSKDFDVTESRIPAKLTYFLTEIYHIRYSLRLKGEYYM